MINTWKEWEKNFFNAKRFFESKGNLQTRSRLKDKWYKEFFNIFEKIEEELKSEDTQKGCGKELGNCKCGKPCSICDGKIHYCDDCKGEKE